MIFFKCKHPFDSLSVSKDATVVEVDADFCEITYHFYCRKCGEEMKKGYAKFIDGVDAFMSRGKGAP